MNGNPDASTRWRSLWAIGLAVLLAGAVNGCGSGAGGDAATATTTTTTTTDTESDTDTATDTTTTDTSTTTTTTTTTVSAEEANTLAVAYPGGLALAAFPQTVDSAALALQSGGGGGGRGGGGGGGNNDNKGRRMKEKKEEADAILRGDGDCVSPAFTRTRTAPSVGCYQFDQEMIYGQMTGGMGPMGGGFNGTQDGTNGAGEACLVSFARAQIVAVETMIDKTLGLVQSMMCQAKKAGRSDALPGVGESLNLATELGQAMGQRSLAVTSATIQRLADQNNSPVYRSDIEIRISESETRDLTLVHSPVAEGDNSTYTGVLWTRVTDSTRSNSVSSPADRYLSIRYTKSSATSITAELLRANIHEALAGEAISGDGSLNLNTGAVFTGNENDMNYGSYVDPAGSVTFSNVNQAVAGMTYIAFNSNPETSAGTVSYWQNPGGNYSENARGMVFALAADETTGRLVGCGNSGATGSNPNNGFSIRKFKRDGAAQSLALLPNGFYHPFMNTSSGTISQGTDDAGAYYEKASSGGGGGMGAKWYLPAVSDSALATEWVTSQTGDIALRQCVSQNAEGLYVIDTTLVPDQAGFELFRPASDASKRVAGPDLTGLRALSITP